jgi:hypothetical protein
MVGLLICWITWCAGHALFISPSPRKADANFLKEFPCGLGLKDKHGADVPVTTLAPGFHTIQFRETIDHRGAPFRIALSDSDDNFDKYVLLDHIPHCDHNCGNVPRDLFVTVEIPDVRCDRCVLQLIQIMTDKFSAASTCENPGGLPSSCGDVNRAYFSCSNVVISGSGSLAPFYHSLVGGSFSERVSYERDETDDVAWVPYESGYLLNSSINTNNTSSSTLSTTSPTKVPTGPPMNWTLPASLFGAVLLVIVLVTVIFVVVRRRRHRREMQQPPVKNFDAFREDELDSDF